MVEYKSGNKIVQKKAMVVDGIIILRKKKSFFDYQNEGETVIENDS